MCLKKYKEVPLGDVPITYADISGAKEFLNYNPQTNLEDGLKTMFEWIKTIYNGKD